VTLNFAKEVVDPFHPDKRMKSCGEYVDSDYDECIETNVAKEMGRIFNCSLPFLRPDKRLRECDLANVTDSERKHVYDTFTGLILFL